MGQGRGAGQQRGDVGAGSKLPGRFSPGRAGRGEADGALPPLPAPPAALPGRPEIALGGRV